MRARRHPRRSAGRRAGTHHRVAQPAPPTLLRVVWDEVPWRSLDELHRMMLDDVLTEHGLTGLTDTDRAELVSAWHRLRPWPTAATVCPGCARPLSPPPCPWAASRFSSTLPAPAECRSTPSCPPNRSTAASPTQRCTRWPPTLLEVVPPRVLRRPAISQTCVPPTPTCAPHAFHARWNGARHSAPPAPDRVDLTVTDIPDLARRLAPRSGVHAARPASWRAELRPERTTSGPGTHAWKQDKLRRSCCAGPGRAPRPGRSEPT